VSRTLPAGEVLLEDASRSFPARSDRARTFKELFTSLSSRGSGQPELEATQALAGVSLHVAPGETVGIVGRNGAGKTSTLRVLAGIIPLQSGYAGCGGRVATLIELGAGFGREFTGRENMRLNAALNGMSKDEIDERIDEMIAFSELGHFIDVPIKAYSSGMLVRLGFAVAAHLDADVLLIDEVLAVGDEAFQRKCVRRILMRIEHGTTVVLVSHAPATIEQVCKRVVVLDSGRLAFDGPTAEGLHFYHRLLGLEDAEHAAARRARNYAVELREATIQDGSARPKQVFSIAEPLRLALDLVTSPGAPDVDVLIEIRQPSGHPVFRTRTTATTSRGGGQLAFEIGRLALLGGDYEIAIGIHEPGDTAPGIDRLLPFSVTGAEDAEGIADLRGTWTYAGEPVEAAR
jgi:ABC-type polysaccharide/polyol phosphate transport system ATPase subunit